MDLRELAVGFELKEELLEALLMCLPAYAEISKTALFRAALLLSGCVGAARLRQLGTLAGFWLQQ